MLSRPALRPWALNPTKPLVQTSFRFTKPSPSTLPSAFTLRVAPSSVRSFSASPASNSWLVPRRGHSGKTRKGRPRMRTGGSTAGTTVIWGDYGLRMCDHDRRVSSQQLQIGWNAIRQRLRGMKFRMIPRVAAERAVFTSGNEQRMGKGKGSFDYYASLVAVNHMIFELKGDVHEKVVRDAFRLAAAKMPGMYEFVKKGDPPVMGMTKVMEGMTLESISRPWLVEAGQQKQYSAAAKAGVKVDELQSGRVPPVKKEKLEVTADRLGSTTP